MNLDNEENHISPISKDERRRRQDAVDFARASIGLEGFKLDDKTEIRAQQFIRGEIDLVEFIKMSST